MTAPYFGFMFRRDSLEPSPPSNAIMSVVGMAGPMTHNSEKTTQTAFEAKFPVNTCVMFTSTDATAAMIDPESEIGRALSAINSQLGRMQFSARVICVRTAEGTDSDPDTKFWQTVYNIMGSSASGTGLYAFKRAGAAVGCYPRLVCIPGYTSQRPTGVESVNVTTAGSGYHQATTTAAITEYPEVELSVTVDASGGVSGITVDRAGYEIVAPATVVITDSDPDPGTGAVASAVIGDCANPICAMLPGVLQSYLGVAVVDAPATTEAEAIEWRETMQSDRLITIEPKVKILSEAGTLVDVPASPYIIGIAVRRDFEFEGRPFRGWANQPIYGIVGPSRAIEFNLTDGSVEGQDLLMHQVGVIVRGESGDDFAIADGGYVAVVINNLDEASGGIWDQLHKVRGRDFVELTVLRTLRHYLGRYNLTTHTIQAVINTVGNILNIAQSKQDILGYAVRFDPSENNPDDLRSGKIYVDMRFEESPMFRLASIISRPHRPALVATIAALTASVTLTESVSSAEEAFPAA